MVRLEGFEPPTIRVEAGYSIQLSYSRMYLFILNPLYYPLYECQLVRLTGIEPVRPYGHQILSLRRLPITPQSLVGLGRKNRTSASCSQSTGDTISLYRGLCGVGDRTRTCIILICNQVPSHSAHTHIWYLVTGSNRRHPTCKEGAATAELTRQIDYSEAYCFCLSGLLID